MLGGLLLPYFSATWIELYALKIKIYMFMGYAELGVSFAYPNNFTLRQPDISCFHARVAKPLNLVIIESVARSGNLQFT